jgi:hypothetical protein
MTLWPAFFIVSPGINTSGIRCINSFLTLRLLPMAGTENAKSNAILGNDQMRYQIACLTMILTALVMIMY